MGDGELIGHAPNDLTLALEVIEAANAYRDAVCAYRLHLSATDTDWRAFAALEVAEKWYLVALGAFEAAA